MKHHVNLVRRPYDWKRDDPDLGDRCRRCGGSGVEPPPTGTPRIGAPSCLACGGLR